MENEKVFCSETCSDSSQRAFFLKTGGEDGDVVNAAANIPVS
jgi:hypothetical protein